MINKLKHPFSFFYLLFFVGMAYYLVNSFISCTSPQSTTVASIKDQYLGDQNCASCHKEEYDDWLGSHHDLAMQEATPQTVLGNFDDQTFESNGVITRFSQEGERYIVTTEGPDGESQDFEVKYTFGVFPLQQYMVAFPGGRVQCLLTAWDAEKNIWFDLMPEERIKPDDWLHWTKGSMTWNAMCADCHSTYLEKNFDETTDSYDTQWKIINVSCEACHGPGKAHNDYANSKDYKSGKKQEGSFLKLTADVTSKEQVDECARCHARRSQISEVFDHAGEFMDHYIPEILRPGLYHPDGQILDEVYVYGSFLQSKMYRNNVYCTSCHDPHTLKVKFPDNRLCTQCHIPETYDTPEHHFHPVGTKSADCKSCHMPGKIYMGNDFRHDHSFRVPRPDQSVLYGTPNTCNGCHNDQSAQWAADAIKNWYGPDRAPHFSDAIAAGIAGDLSALPELIRMMGDTSQPEIARATAIWLMGETNLPETQKAITDALKDDNAIIRYYAVTACERFSQEEKFRHLTPLLKDPVLAVRSHARYVIAEVPANLLQGDSKSAFDKTEEEFEKILDMQADFPAGQLLRGQFYHKQRKLPAARTAYQESIRQDPYLPQPYMYLARIFYQQGDIDNAEKHYLDAIRVHPESIEANYSFGLLLAELNRLGDAEKYIGKAAGLSNIPRYYYNWGLIHQNLQNPSEAEKVFKSGLAISPEDQGLLYALAVLYIQQRKAKEAQPIIMQLLQLDPQNPDYQNLLRAIQ